MEILVYSSFMEFFQRYHWFSLEATKESTIFDGRRVEMY
jgi:hypothetical protein